MGHRKGLAGDTFSGMQCFLRKRGVLTYSWRLCRAWGKCELPARAPPMPPLTTRLHSVCCLALPPFYALMRCFWLSLHTTSVFVNPALTNVVCVC
eukprot:5650605-Amphidinium_carterae.1